MLQFGYTYVAICGCIHVHVGVHTYVPLSETTNYPMYTLLHGLVSLGQARQIQAPLQQTGYLKNHLVLLCKLLLVAY